MKIKVSEATGVQLDWLVAKCEGHTLSRRFGRTGHPVEIEDFKNSGPMPFSPTTDWAQGGPIMEREQVALTPVAATNGTSVEWLAGNYKNARGPTMLIAGLRCFIVSRMGEEVEIPEELK